MNTLYWPPSCRTSVVLICLLRSSTIWSRWSYRSLGWAVPPDVDSAVLMASLSLASCCAAVLIELMLPLICELMPERSCCIRPSRLLNRADSESPAEISNCRAEVDVGFDATCCRPVK